MLAFLVINLGYWLAVGYLAESHHFQKPYIILVYEQLVLKWLHKNQSSKQIICYGHQKIEARAVTTSDLAGILLLTMLSSLDLLVIDPTGH